MSPPVQPVADVDALPQAVDVVVVGAGIAGVAAAYELARKGHRVAVIEKGVVSGEQSSRNWGWCRQQNRDLRELPLSMWGLRRWEELAAETGRDLGFRRTGLVYVTDKPGDLAEWERWGETARPFQMQTRMLTAAEAEALTPGSRGGWLGGLQSPTDGRAEPSLAVPGLAEAARALGATIHQNCAVRGFHMEAGRLKGVVTERGLVRADAVLLAGGVWTGLMMRRHGLRFVQASVRSTSFATVPAPAVTEGGLALPGVTLRRRLDGGFTVGMSGRGLMEVSLQGLRYAGPFWQTFKKRRAGLAITVGRSFVDGPEGLARWSMDAQTPFERNRTLDPPPERRLIEAGLASMGAAYPTLKGIAVARSWGGQVDMTPDAIPVISPVEPVPGLFVSAGFSGHGFGIGPAAGRLAADLVAGDAPIVDPHPYRYSRMTDGTDLGAPGMI
ncbi:FAD-binding oxidoreductase [Lichenibacterium minor]|uniref:FAD-binding oxidoreductase n=1 Tax=Lichenibacterium minor TaxID=2316528 RepID=A0A4Q2U1I2_9HYPH|nr:FAD-binding oxidoreductase [Lichenibacterium minor]RYC29940.1 FAD-binding oxidoreductase [Lichenibacterium minor]